MADEKAGGDGVTNQSTVVLTPRAIFGFNGEVENGLLFHPDKKHLLYPLGKKICISNTETKKQNFLSAHSNDVSCLTISLSGKYFGSGQINHMGFRAYVIIWDFEKQMEIGRHDLHKVRVQSMCFSAEDRYLISIGGQDDGSVVVYDLASRSPICRSAACSGISGHGTFVCALHNNSSFFLVCGDRHLRMWSIQREFKKLHVHDVNVGKQQRRYTVMRIDKSNEHMFLGTMTGDIVKVVINRCGVGDVTKLGHIASLQGAYGVYNPRKPFGKDCNRYVNGVRNLVIIDEGLLLIGAGDGTIDLVEERKDVSESKFKEYPSPTWPMLRSLKRVKVSGAITSIEKLSAIEYYIATNQNEIYSINLNTFKLKLLKTCHLQTVQDIRFPKNLSTIFATAGYESIRIWSVKRLQEMLRIIVFNFECAAVAFTDDGTSIVSVWNDGIIRAFTPVTGKLIYAIPNAHNKGCSALAVSSNGRLIVSGGIEGQVRFWKIETLRQSLIGIVKDHSSPVTSVAFNNDDTELLSTSIDGSCVIWDVKRLNRKKVITTSTQLLHGVYFPNGAQFMTCGADGRIKYWMAVNALFVRELEASIKSPVNSIAVSTKGHFLMSVGSDQDVKLWDSDSGCLLGVGKEHATPVMSCQFSPCGKFFVSGSKDGTIIIWDMPEEYLKQQALPEPKPASARSNTGSKTENINILIASTKVGEVCCVECPPIEKKKPIETCEYIPDVKKC